ncbi:MAG: hypothetical protein JNK72_08555 [Myxococcales bacterium]|nr:hypothetical protein [Myxococcales bacterium]
MQTLIVCEGCSRHVLSHEAGCPFCGAAVAAQSPVCGADPSAARGLSRGKAALMAAVTVAASLSMAACYGGPPRPPAYNPADAATQAPANPAPGNGTP